MGLIFQVAPSYDWLWLESLSETSPLRELQVNSEYQGNSYSTGVLVQCVGPNLSGDIHYTCKAVHTCSRSPDDHPGVTHL